VKSWSQTSAHSTAGQTSLVERPIVDDRQALRVFHANPDIDGLMKLGGDAVANVLRNLPNAKWSAWTLAIDSGGFGPFKMASHAHLPQAQ